MSAPNPNSNNKKKGNGINGKDKEDSYSEPSQSQSDLYYQEQLNRTHDLYEGLGSSNLQDNSFSPIHPMTKIINNNLNSFNRNGTIRNLFNTDETGNSIKIYK